MVAPSDCEAPDCSLSTIPAFVCLVSGSFWNPENSFSFGVYSSACVSVSVGVSSPFYATVSFEVNVFPCTYSGILISLGLCEPPELSSASWSSFLSSSKLRHLNIVTDINRIIRSKIILFVPIPPLIIYLPFYTSLI